MRLEQAPEPLSVDVRPDRQRVFVVPRGELDMATVDQLAAEIEELVGRGFETVVVDLRAMSFLDSSGLHLLLKQSARNDADVTLIDGKSSHRPRGGTPPAPVRDRPGRAKLTPAQALPG